jgi:hypothetical protein
MLAESIGRARIKSTKAGSFEAGPAARELALQLLAREQPAVMVLHPCPRPRHDCLHWDFARETLVVFCHVVG